MKTLKEKFATNIVKEENLSKISGGVVDAGQSTENCEGTNDFTGWWIVGITDADTNKTGDFYPSC